MSNEKIVIRPGSKTGDQKILTDRKQVVAMVDHHLHRYLSETFDNDRPKARILDGEPVVMKTPTLNSCIAFRSSDFRRYLADQSIQITNWDLANILRELGLYPTQISVYVPSDRRIKTEVTRCWIFSYQQDVAHLLRVGKE